MDDILQQLGLDALVHKFQLNKITPKDVANLKDTEFTELGVSSLGDRVRIRSLCAASCQSSESEPSPIVQRILELNRSRPSKSLRQVGNCNRNAVSGQKTLHFGWLHKDVGKYKIMHPAKGGGSIKVKLNKTLTLQELQHDVLDRYFPDGESFSGLKIDDMVYFLGNFAGKHLPRTLDNGKPFSVGGYCGQVATDPVRIYLFTDKRTSQRNLSNRVCTATLASTQVPDSVSEVQLPKASRRNLSNRVCTATLASTQVPDSVSEMQLPKKRAEEHQGTSRSAMEDILPKVMFRKTPSVFEPCIDLTSQDFDSLKEGLDADTSASVAATGSGMQPSNDPGPGLVRTTEPDDHPMDTCGSLTQPNPPKQPEADLCKHTESGEAVNTNSNTNETNSQTNESSLPGVGKYPDTNIDQSSVPEVSAKYQDKHSYCDKWEEQWPWLDYEGGKMYCRLCIKHKKQNTMTVGCKTYRTNTFTRHVETSHHKEATEQEALSKQFQLAATSAVKRSAAEPGVAAAMRTVFWMAKEDIPVNKYPSFVGFLKFQGCDELSRISVADNATYNSRQSGEEFQECVAKTIHENVIKSIKEADFFSILTDESTDISISKQMVVYARVVDKNLVPHTFFLKNITITESKSGADILFRAILDYLHAEGLDICKLQGFGSDGASVMVGRHSGVATRLKNVSPHMTSIHCMAHRFNLCTSQASKGISYIKDFEQTLTDLYYYFGGSKSGNRKVELEEIQKIVEDPRVKIKECHEIRWIAFYDAVYAVFRSWMSLVTYFKGHKDKKSVSFFEKLTDYRFLACIHLLMDILPSVAQMSMILQKRDIDVAAIPPALDGLKEKISIAQKGNSYYQMEFREKIVKIMEPKSAKSATTKDDRGSKSTDDISKKDKTSKGSHNSKSKNSKKDKTSKPSRDNSGKDQASKPPDNNSKNDRSKTDHSKKDNKGGPGQEQDETKAESDRKTEMNTKQKHQEVEKDKHKKKTESQDKNKPEKDVSATCIVKFRGHELIHDSSHGKQIQEFRQNFCENLLSNINSRFPKEAVTVSMAFHVLSCRPISFLSKDELKLFGQKELEILTSHYGHEATRDGVVSQPLIDPIKCIEEWSLAKRIILDQKYPRDKTATLWQLMHEFHAESVPNLIILAQLALIMPYQTAECERGFSCQNNIKTSKRNRLREGHLNDLMTIKLEGGDYQTYDFSKAISIWKSKKKRRLAKHMTL